MPIDTNLNQTPFFDDYDENKNYHRVLFRPAVPVQARELTQLQTILQNQIERFGDHVFVQGSIIKGCSFSFDNNYYFAKILDLNADGIEVNMEQYTNTYVVDESTGLKALVIDTATGLQSDTSGNFNTLYFKYLNVGSGGEKTFANNRTLTLFHRDYSIQSVVVDDGGTGYSNGDLVTFVANTAGVGATGYVITTGDGRGAVREVVITSGGAEYEEAPAAIVIYKEDGTTATDGTDAILTARNFIDKVVTPTTAQTASTGDPIGSGYALSITDGVIYQKGAFVRVDEQSTIVSKYTTSPDGVVVGFRTIETIANNALDSSLNDNAAGFTNASAPGAFRLKLTPQLITLNKADAAANNEFFTLVEFENGQAVRQNQQAAYSEISKEFARRTFEESGNYVVRRFNVNTEEHPTDGTKLNAVIGSGLGYVDGYRVELLNTTRVPFNKATTTVTNTGASISAGFGSYVIAHEYKGLFDLTSPQVVKLRNVAGADVSTNTGGTPGTPGGSGGVIGTAYVRGLEYNSGVPGTAAATYRIYLFGITMNAGQTFDQVRSLTVDGIAIADIVLEYQSTTAASIAVLKETALGTGVFPSGAVAVKSISSDDYQVRTNIINVSLDTLGSSVLNITGGYTLPFSGTLPQELKDQLIVVPSASVYATWGSRNGTIAVSDASTTVTGTNTLFLSQYAPGDYIAIADGSGNYNHTRQISKIVSNTSLELTANAATSFSGVQHTRAFPRSTPIPLTGRTSSLGNVTVTVNSSTQLTINLGETLISGTTISVTLDVRTAYGRRSKTIVKNAYVKIAAADITSTTTSWGLGVPDVLRVVSVHKTTDSSTYDEAIDVSSSFILDNGQRDAHYGLARLIKRPGSVLALDGTFNLVVRLDVFQHTSGGYFTVDSYPLADALSVDETTISWAEIPTFTSPAGNRLPLRDCLDTRVVMANTVAYSTTLSSAGVVDQANSGSFDTVIHPVPNSLFSADIERFLPRRDLIVLDNKGRVRVIEGVPATTPSTPVAPKGTIVLVDMVTPPYPTLAATNTYNLPEYTTSIVAKQNQRYTMKDIERLDGKISQLQYYALLSSLEMDTKNKVIPSESDVAVERFKNGFFADPLMTFDFVDTTDPERRIAIDTRNATASPTFEQSKFDLKIGRTSGVVKRGQVVTLSYNSRELISQPVATNSRNPVQYLYAYNGAAYLSPNYDNYVSTTANPVVIDMASPIRNLVDNINDVFEEYHLNQSASTDVSSQVSSRTVGSTTTRTTSTRTTTKTSWDYLQLSMSAKTQTQTVGSFVTDLTINPYMKGRPIVFFATGLRPGTRHYVFFDEKAVGSLCVPGRLRANWAFERVPTIDDINITGSKGSPIVSNSSGVIVGVFYMPDNMFFTGERELILADVDDLTGIDTATSRCGVKYNAFNMEIERGNVTMLTPDPGGTLIQTQRASVTNSSTVTSSTTTTVSADKPKPPPRPDPLAQTFLISNEIARQQDGLYLTEVDLYFKEKDPVFGLVVELRTVELGVPTRTRLGSARLDSSQVKISSNASVATTVVFDTPVYVKADQEYAVVIMPEANTPNYRVWTGKAGEFDISNPSIQKTQDWNQGAMFLSTNASTWTAFQNEDVKLAVRFAEFTQTAGELELVNDDYEFFTLSNSTGSLEVGEPVGMLGNTYIEKTFSCNTSSATITASGDVSTDLIANDVVVIIKSSSSSTKAFTASVVNGSSTLTLSAEHANTVAVNDYITVGPSIIRRIASLPSSTSIVVDKAMTLATGSGLVVKQIIPEYEVARVVSVASAAVTLNKYPKFVANTTALGYVIKAVGGEIDFIGKDQSVVHLKKSNASSASLRFTAGARFVGGLSNTVATIATVDNPGISYFDTLVTSIIHPGTAVSATAEIMDQSGTKTAGTVTLNNKNELERDSAVWSRSNEITLTGQPKSVTTTLTLSSDSVWSAPAVNVSPASVLRYKYKINSADQALVGENTRQGNAAAKYVSKPIVLADGQEGEDLKVYVSAYRPVGTDIVVYTRIVNETDGTDFYDQEWTQMKLVSANVYSSSSNKTEYREYEYTFDTAPPRVALEGVGTTTGSATITTTADQSSAVAAGDLIVLTNPSNSIAEVRTVVSVDNTTIEVSADVTFSATGVVIERVTQASAAFKNYEGGSAGVVRYFNKTLGAFDGYKTFAVKVVLVSSSYTNIPRLDDVRAIACSI